MGKNKMTYAVQDENFRVDTRRSRSRSKMRAQFRHVMAVAAGMFPLMALFVFAMSFLRLTVERPPYHRLAIIFLAAGMVALLLYAWARAEKLRRREKSARNRELKYRERHAQAQAELARQRQALHAPTPKAE